MLSKLNIFVKASKAGIKCIQAYNYPLSSYASKYNNTNEKTTYDLNYKSKANFGFKSGIEEPLKGTKIEKNTKRDDIKISKTMEDVGPTESLGEDANISTKTQAKTRTLEDYIYSEIDHDLDIGRRQRLKQDFGSNVTDSNIWRQGQKIGESSWYANKDATENASNLNRGFVNEQLEKAKDTLNATNKTGANINNIKSGSINTETSEGLWEKTKDVASNISTKAEDIAEKLKDTVKDTLNLSDSTIKKNISENKQAGAVNDDEGIIGKISDTVKEAADSVKEKVKKVTRRNE